MYPAVIKIYSEKKTPRLSYSAELIFGNIMGLGWEIVTDTDMIRGIPAVNYSRRIIPGSFRVEPCSLLFEKGIIPQEIQIRDWKGLPVFFSASGSGSVSGIGPEPDIPFDIFAASFYLVSRYEEYQDYRPDRHGRFPASVSAAYRHGFLNIPVVDLWAGELAKALGRKYPELKFSFRKYNALLTVDTDQPFAYLGKGIVRTAGGLLRNLLHDPRKAAERIRVLTGKAKDPFDVYDYILRNISEKETDAIFFFPTGNFSKYDRNPHWRNRKYRRLIRKLGNMHASGMHPSYPASEDTGRFRSERERLDRILNRRIMISRFHFIRMKIPEAYRMIYGEGISEDYSMGYPDHPGFRAGIARPFLFYDLTGEKQTDLKIIPFQYMDSTFYHYMNLGPPEAEEIIVRLMDETRKAGGLFVSLWHNTTITATAEGRGWRKLFEKMLAMQKP
jgi:hypothetical protein